MIARGEMPRLQALLTGGAHAILRAEPEQVPAIVWTTIATGRGPEAHGIRSTGARRLPGMRVPMPLTGRRSVRSRAGDGHGPPAARARAAGNLGAARGQDVLERRFREGPARRRGELVGDVAGRSRQRLRGDRARAVQAGEGRRRSSGRPHRPRCSIACAPWPRRRRTSRAGSTRSRWPRRARCAGPLRPTSKPSTCPASTSPPCSTSARAEWPTWPASTRGSTPCAATTDSWTVSSARRGTAWLAATCSSWSAIRAGWRGARARRKACSSSAADRGARRPGRRLRARRRAHRAAPRRAARQPGAGRARAGGGPRPRPSAPPIRCGRWPPTAAVRRGRPAESAFDRDMLEELRALGYIQ